MVLTSEFPSPTSSTSCNRPWLGETGVKVSHYCILCAGETCGKCNNPLMLGVLQRREKINPPRAFKRHLAV